MKKVLCTLPNASKLISGVVFEPSEEGMLSVEVDDSIAAGFEGIGGYSIKDAKEEGKKPLTAEKSK